VGAGTENVFRSAISSCRSPLGGLVRPLREGTIRTISVLVGQCGQSIDPSIATPSGQGPIPINVLGSSQSIFNPYSLSSSIPCRCLSSYFSSTAMQRLSVPTTQLTVSPCRRWAPPPPPPPWGGRGGVVPLRHPPPLPSGACVVVLWGVCVWLMFQPRHILGVVCSAVLAPPLCFLFPSFVVMFFFYPFFF